MTAPALTLPQEVLLLALDERSGEVRWRSQSRLTYALAGAILAELALRVRIATPDKHTSVLDSEPTGDAVLDAALARIAAERKPRELKHWAGKIATTRGLKQQVARQLTAAGVLREENRKFLAIIPDTRFIESNPAPEAALRERLRAAVAPTAAPDERTVLLLMLMRIASLTSAVFPDKQERTAAERRAKELAATVSGSAAAEAARKAAEEVEAALSIAVIAATAAGNN